ncbi:hypothetical protein TRIUR3_15776 [Triticum urartu]|uniref:Uncharacterized protein n=1 Tax=Triticum urartu TaxID=4572 RepID=M7YZP8_TRIUA|nr:hypothetical protein TRIUR3_15776 [Triticum urartu]
MEMGKETARVVVLALNGVRREAAGADVHPSMTLLEFLRTKTPVRGPKISCGEGYPTNKTNVAPSSTCFISNQSFALASMPSLYFTPEKSNMAMIC